MHTCRPSGSTTAGMFVSEDGSCTHKVRTDFFYYAVSLNRPKEHCVPNETKGTYMHLHAEGGRERKKEASTTPWERYCRGARGEDPMCQGLAVQGHMHVPCSRSLLTL